MFEKSLRRAFKRVSLLARLCFASHVKIPTLAPRLCSEVLPQWIRISKDLEQGQGHASI